MTALRFVHADCTGCYNVRHQAWGRLFGDRYKAIVVDGADTYHYRTLANSIHFNLVRARLVLLK